MYQRFLFVALFVAGCASQDTIPEVKPAAQRSSDCGLAALADSSPSERNLGSCGGALQELDDDGSGKKRR